MSLKWRFYFAAVLIIIIGSFGGIAIGLYTDVTQHKFLDSLGDIFAYAFFLFLGLKSIVNIICFQKYKTNAFVSKSTKTIFYVLFCIGILCTFLLIIGVIISSNNIVSKGLKASTLIAYSCLYLYTLSSIYCIVLDIPLLKKIDQRRP